MAVFCKKRGKFLLLLLLVLVTMLSFMFAESKDTQALQAFRVATDAHGNLAKNWTGTDACKQKWEGVTCKNGRVFFLSLPGYDLRGPISALVSLDQLRVLNLHSNRLNSSLEAITECQNLKLLYMSSNDFSGPIPPRIASLRRLLRVDFSGNNLRGPIPSGFQNLTRLRTLHLQNNLLSGPVPPDLSFLSDFNVSNNELSGEIPKKLMQKFPASSFMGNAGLCGRAPFPACSLHVSSPPDIVVPSNPSTNPGSSSSVLPAPHKVKSKGLSTPAIVAIVVGDAAVLVLITSLFLLYYWRKYLREANHHHGADGKGCADNVEASGRQSPDVDRSKLVFFDRKKQFELEDLLRASAEMLGKGSFGTAYKAVLDDGCIVAVKRLKDVGPSGKKEFEQHMELIGRLRHPHIVRLRAYYYAKDEKLLVYDYLPNGSLYSLLHGNRGPGRTPLDWTTRVGIVLGAARGLAFIHEEYGSLKIPHGNIKSSNVLLDKNGNACISDFGLALLLGPSHTALARHAGYKAPEQSETKKLSQKADVYSFGVLLLEVLTGKAAAQHQSQEEFVDLPKWVRSIVREEWTAEVFDIELMRYKNIEEEMVSMLQVALSCVSHVPEQRPKMTDVVKMIENIKVEQSPARGEWEESHSASPSASEEVATSC